MAGCLMLGWEHFQRSTQRHVLNLSSQVLELISHVLIRGEMTDGVSIPKQGRDSGSPLQTFEQEGLPSALQHLIYFSCF